MRGKKISFNKETRKKIYEKYKYMCANNKDDKCLFNQQLSIHHIIPNTKLNAKLYGDKFLQSEKNGILLCSWCHEHVNEIKWIQELKENIKKELSNNDNSSS